MLCSFLIHFLTYFVVLTMGVGARPPAFVMQGGGFVVVGSL
jgi:hypothetical protein